MASVMKAGRSVKTAKGVMKALSLICCAGFILAGCGPRSGFYPESTLGTPEHHVFNGFALLRMERLEDAQREFEQALRLDANCSGAYRGIGWIQGQRNDFAAPFASMTHAKKIAKEDLEKALVEVGFMGLYTFQKGPDWVQRVEQSFKAASSLEEDLPEAYFQLGIAYKEAYRFKDAEKALQKVIWIHGSLVSEAKEELESLVELKRK